MPIGLLLPLETEEDEKPEKVEEEVKPPTNITEFLKAEGLDDWPLPMSLEGPLDIQSEGLFIGNQDDIADILKEAAPVGLHMMDEMESRLSELEDKINFYAHQIVTDNIRPSRLADRLFHSPSRTFITDVSESDAVKSHRSSKGHKSVDLVDTMLETRKRSLDYYTFPGFVHGEFIELPAQLEAPPMLHRVTTVQDFNPGFRKFWKKLFLSEASSAVLQDAFWWIFLDYFHKEEAKQLTEDKDCLFDRIADSYVALFTSINTDVKDKFLSVYPDCLAQAVFCTFRESFPESKMRFNEDFKKYLVDLVYEWVTGLKPYPGVWNAWNEEGLEGSQTHRENETHKKMLEAAVLHKKVDLTLDMDGFNKIVEKLGTEYLVSPQGNIIREVTKTSNRLPSRGKGNKQESHQIGPGPDYERVKFNTSGRSPLIAHYLHMRQLRSYKQPGMKVRRTEIMKLPPEGQTYQQFIASTNAKADAMSREYTRFLDQTSTEILELERKKRDTNRQINALKKSLTEVKTIQERRALMEKIAEFQESDQKELTLLEKETPRSEPATDDSYANDY